jgi:CRP-like cAMP-binding protein
MVKPSNPERPGNILLASLPDEELMIMMPKLEPRPMRDGSTIVEANGRIAEVCFLEGGVASVHEVLNSGSRVGVGIVGYEGFTGWSALLGCGSSPHQVTVAIGGSTGLYISVEDVLAACETLPTLRLLLLRYVQCFVSQLGRTILSNLHDPMERRLARWLLMNHDRLPGDEIRLTHDQLGIMLGVRRASVTDTLHTLEGEHMITSKRGTVIIRDRSGLAVFAGEAYGAAEAAYGKFIAPFAKSGALKCGI